MPRLHRYEVTVTWTGNSGVGTSAYDAYERAHDVSAQDKPVIPGTADRAFRGAPDRWNPEELLVASLSQCHLLWYLALCAKEGIVVTAYDDHASGTMVEAANGSGRFEEVVLKPRVMITTAEHADRARQLHERAHEMCFVANSVNFTVRTEADLMYPAE